MSVSARFITRNTIPQIRYFWVHPAFFSGFMLTCMSNQKESRHRKTDVIASKWIKPKGVMPKAHAELQQCIGCIVDKSSVKRYIHSKSCVILPESCLPVFIFECFEKANQIRYLKTPYRQCVEGKYIGNDCCDWLCSPKHHRISVFLLSSYFFFLLL